MLRKRQEKPPKTLGNPLHLKLVGSNIRKIIENYRNHSSIFKITEILKEKPISTFEATTGDINKIIKSLNSNKATGPDRIPLKFIKITPNVTDSHLAYIINKNTFSEML